MMYAKPLFFGLAIAVIGAAAQANAGNGNPLDPNFYWRAAPKVQPVTSDAKPYVDSRNPLHAAYPRVKGVAVWQRAVAPTGRGYRDSTNPLHPSFER
jgi:hypothetical protein